MVIRDCSIKKLSPSCYSIFDVIIQSDRIIFKILLKLWSFPFYCNSKIAFWKFKYINLCVSDCGKTRFQFNGELHNFESVWAKIAILYGWRQKCIWRYFHKEQKIFQGKMKKLSIFHVSIFCTHIIIFIEAHTSFIFSSWFLSNI